MEKEIPLTEKEEEFLKYLKRELIFTNIKIRTKISLEELCEESGNIMVDLNRNREAMKGVLIDFVLYRNNKAIAGIEVVDEPDEFLNSQGEKILKNFIFNTLGYECFRVVEMDRLKQSARFIKNEVLKK
ncbi:MAG: hypothetical protein J6Z03_05770 [Erysipelotrichaceae bacterium]|nr:hypothetical protein [Erysipelotrichaceae bacterium]